jgi:polysaccharide pyruvyl transferase WcaK-like protein
VIDDDGRDLMDAFLAGAVALGARDESSAAFAMSLSGVDPQVVTVTGDDALGLAAATDPLTASLIGPRERPTLAVTVRRAEYVGAAADDPVRRWAVAADALAAERGWDVLGVALNAQEPEPEIVTLATLRATVPLRARWRLVECGADPARLVAAISGSVAVATQSYHAALFGLAAGVPTVLGAATPYYVAKAGGLATLAGLPNRFAVTDPDTLGDALDRVAAAMAGKTAPLVAAGRAADAWWTALPTALGVIP